MDFARPAFFKRNPWAAYVFAVLNITLAATLTSLLWLIVERPASAPIFLAAIVISTLCGGMRVGIFASVLGGLALDYFFIQPYYQLVLARDDVFRFILFFVEGALLSWITEKLRIATEDLQRSREELRELTGHQQTLREEEQKRIAREIHDELGQMLTGLKLDIHLLRKKGVTEGDNGISAGLEDLSSRVDSTIGSVRRIASEIRPSILDDFGLIAALEWQTAEFERKAEVECAFVSNVEDVDIQPEAGAAVFRIVQEALTNIARHAQASLVNVSVTESDGQLTVDVDDNGRGVDVEGVAKYRSLGIMGMRERARLIGATIDIRRRVQGGTTVELTLPVHDA